MDAIEPRSTVEPAGVGRAAKRDPVLALHPFEPDAASFLYVSPIPLPA